MLVLFDNNVRRTLARYLLERHTITEARARDWGELGNGDLLTEAEAAGFDVFLTANKNLSYQQNLTNRKIAIVVLGLGPWSAIRLHTTEVVAAVDAATPGSYAMVVMPHK